MKKLTIISIISIILIIMSMIGFYNVEATSAGEGATSPGTQASSDSKTDENTKTTTADFSKAKYELKKDGTSKAMLTISGVTQDMSKTYNLYITANNSKPDISTLANEKISLTYDDATKTFRITDIEKLAKYIELNQDMYVTVTENDTIVDYGKKIEKFAEPKYSDAFFATVICHSNDQIVTNFTHSKENSRKIQVKIGKITDTSILQKIKNQDSSGFSSLMTFAKSNNTTIYNQTLNANSDHALKYESNSGNGLINLSNSLEDQAYFYLYIKTDGENGKYVSNEAVTLARASVYNNGSWFMFFYGSDDFKWADFSSTPAPETPSTPTPTPSTPSTPAPDPTVATGELPRTGTKIVIFTVVLFVVITSAIIAYRKYKKYNF